MRKQLLLLSLFSLLLASSVLASYQYYQSYYSGGFGDFSGLFENFWSFIQGNEYLVDSIVFLVIFLVLAKKVFYGSFSQDKLLYVVIGIALTIGIMAYEKRAGYSFVINSGPLAIAALFLLGIFLVSQGGFRGFKLLSASILYIVLYFWFTNNYFTNNFLSWLYENTPPAIPSILFMAAIVGIGVGIYQMVKGEKSKDKAEEAKK